MKKSELNRVKEVGKKTIADFICSETGSVGVRNAATIGVFASALALGQSTGEATIRDYGNGSTVTTITTAI